MATFTAIPTLPLSAALSPNTKPQFLLDLRHALLHTGFLYLSETGLPPQLTQSVVRECHAFFEDLDTPDKLAIEMKNKGSFLGYSRLGNEVTAGAADWREQLDLSTPHELPKATDPLYYNLFAPNQWPAAEKLPTFRPVLEEYMARMGELSIKFTSLIAEAIGLPATAFDRFFDPDQQHKLKLVKYPDAGVLGVGGQGVGPHKDSMLTSYLLQASEHKGLQAQNTKGEWIDCPPVDGTLVVAIGQGLEALTEGVCTSTTHRVLSPQAGAGPRYSVPFFQGVSYDATFESMEVPEEVKALRRDILDGQGGRRDDVEFTFVKGGRYNHLGEATLMNRIKSHPDVGERWYPDLLAQIREDQKRDAQDKADKEASKSSTVVHSKDVNVNRQPLEAH